MDAGELIFKLGFKADSMKLKDFVRDIGELNMSSILAGGSIAGLFEGIKTILEGTAGLARDMRLFGTETGLSEQRMESWTLAAEQVGLKGEIVAQGLRHIRAIQSNLAHGEMDPGYQKALFILSNYAGLSLDPFENAYSQLKKIQTVWTKLNQDQKQFVISGMGLGEQWIDMFSEGKDFWKEIDNHKMIDAEQIQQFKSLQKEWTALIQEINKASIDFAINVAPTITEFLTGINALMNSEFMKAFSKAIGNSAKDAEKRRVWAGEHLAPVNAFFDKLSSWNRSFEERHNMDYNRMGMIMNPSVTFHIQGNNPQEIMTHVHAGLKEWLSEAHYQTALNYHHGSR